MKRDARFLLLLTAASLAIRLFRIGAQSLWVDEIFTINVSIPRGDLHIWDYLKYNIHGPLHSFIVYLFGLLGTSDGWLRVPSALAGAGAVYFFYRWVKLWLDPRVARVAAVLLAVNPLHVYYSQEVRNYSLLLFFGLAATFYLHRLLTAESRRNFVTFVLTMAAAALCNFTAAFLYATHAVIFLLRKSTTRKRLGRWLVASAVIGVLISPWLYRVYVVIDFGRLATPVLPGQIADEQRLRGETTFSLAGVPYAFYAFGTGFSLGPSLRELHGDARMVSVVRRHAVAVAWALVLFGGLSLVGVRRLLLAAGPWWQVLLYIIVPVAGTLVLNWQNAKAFNVRYVLFAMPAFLALIALGIDGLRRYARAGALVLVVATSVASLANYYFDGEYAREDVRSAARAVDAQIQPGECVVVPTVFEVFQHYFSDPERVRPIFASERVAQASVDRQLASVFAECEGVWYVRARPWENDPHGDLIEAFDRQYDRSQLINYKGVEVLRYASRNLHH